MLGETPRPPDKEGGTTIIESPVREPGPKGDLEEYKALERDYNRNFYLEMEDEGGNEIAWPNSKEGKATAAKIEQLKRKNDGDPGFDAYFAEKKAAEARAKQEAEAKKAVAARAREEAIQREKKKDELRAMIGVHHAVKVEKPDDSMENVVIWHMTPEEKKKLAEVMAKGRQEEAQRRAAQETLKPEQHNPMEDTYTFVKGKPTVEQLAKADQAWVDWAAEALKGAGINPAEGPKLEKKQPSREELAKANQAWVEWAGKKLQSAGIGPERGPKLEVSPQTPKHQEKKGFFARLFGG